ncbi:MAG: L,D-transpeptidase family protein [Desulfobacterales bacterium]|nr:L,D-transpeptidase family protein [Desulfobacterales bacterium]
MQTRVAAAQADSFMVCQGELVCGIADLPSFYARRDHRPAWRSAEGAFAPAGALLRFIERAGEHGLDPANYHLEAIRRLLESDHMAHLAGRRLETNLAVDLDFLLTDAFLLLASHLRAGRVNPETLHVEWVVQMDPEVDVARLLEDAIATGRIEETLQAFAPPHPEYRHLQNALASYRGLAAAGEWPQLPDKATWERGQTGGIAELLRERLARSGDYPHLPNDDADADRELFEALRRFQERHGLEADGRMGAQTLGALNVALTERIRQIELNLERWRWLPHDLGQRHIWVNVPRFTLSVVANGEPALDMRVVVGRHYRRTPVFSSRMDHLVFNPDWNIPNRIAVQDILPKARKDPGHMRREKIRVFEGWNRGAAELDPDEIDWSQVTAGNFRYRLMKDPGPHNDLGRVKFMFPNTFSVYLHDTPSKRLFERSMRGFSSGCIRIEKPLDLAVYVLGDAALWSHEAVTAAINTGQLRTVRLKQPIPVHLVYMTAGADADGGVAFWQDIYQRDAALDRALRQKPPRLP